jgi:hypothetical protein
MRTNTGALRVGMRGSVKTDRTDGTNRTYRSGAARHIGPIGRKSPIRCWYSGLAEPRPFEGDLALVLKRNLRKQPIYDG